jgi:predicted acylesterase/phospholipase RssA
MNMTERLGLTFSGGGFRASFYHIGVLAQMAEQGILRYVEVISAVSGGSIIGALYYLHLKKLLESKIDADITDQDYVQIVQKIEEEFLTATEKNIRMETFSSFKKNFKMRLASYSRSDRLAELYNDHFYQAVLPKYANTGKPLQMQQLMIYPLEDKEKNLQNHDFNPKHDNTKRNAKVPILVLNATTLNTGRNWQFTAQTMGEPPESKAERNENHQNISEYDKWMDRIDKKSIRLRRADSYSDMAIIKDAQGNIILNQQEIPLGHAVAASACVPGLFYPMSITGLYQDLEATGCQNITPQLVDGGVYDNQGTRGVLQYDCTCFVISDASGQMGVENETSTANLSVLLRMSSVLQDRVRSESLKYLLTQAGQEKQGWKNIAFMNLRHGLGIRQIPWIDAAGVQHKNETDTIEATSLKDFQVAPKVQESLSLMRTDLDAFTEVEAYSLMLDGYRMSQPELEKFKSTVEHKGIHHAITQEKSEWKFSEIAPWMEKPTKDYLYQLEVAKAVPLKAVRLLPTKLGVPLALVIAAIVYSLYSQITAVLFDTIPVYMVVVLFAFFVLNKVAHRLAKTFAVLKLLHPYAEWVKRVFEVVGLTFSTLFFKFYLKYINKMFLKRGRVAELKKRDAKNNC